MYYHHDCGCERHFHHAHYASYGAPHHHQGCYGFRRFPTREERIAELEDYLEQLKAEVKGVEEHIAELKKEA